MEKMELYPIQTRLIKEEDSLVDVLLETMKKTRLEIQNNDIIVVASTVVALTEKRKRKINEIQPSQKAIELGKKHKVDPKFMQLILEETDQVIGGPPGFILTIRRGLPCINACVDASNVPKEYYISPPKDAMESAWKIRNEIKSKTGKKVAVIIADSGILPGKRGTIGLALGFAGIKPFKDYIGKKDLYGKILKVTQQSIVDEIASAAQLLMGEADEKVPFVVVRGLKADFTNEKIKFEETLFPLDKCIFMSNIL